MNINQIILLVIPAITFIILCIIKKKSTKPIQLILVSLFCSISYLTYSKLFQDSSTLFKVLYWIDFVILNFVNLFIILSNKYYDFGNYQILSVSYIINLIKNKQILNDNKVLGSIIPFSDRTIKYGGQYIPLTSTNTRSGTIVTGSTGSGKSYTVKQLVEQDCKNGNPVVYFDFKGEQGTYNDLRNIGLKYGYEIYGNKNEEDFYFFDPLFGLSENGKIEAILNTRKWNIAGSDDHYKTNLKVLITKYIKEFDKVLEKKDREGVIIDNSFPYTKNFYNFVNSNRPDLSNPDIKNAYNSLKTILELILTSDFGTIMKENKREKKFKFHPDYSQKYLLIVSISSDSKDLANSFSSFYLRNLLHCGTQETFIPDLMLYIDEAASANPFNYKDILEKGRSAGINTTLIMQDIYQMDIETNEAFTNSLLGTVVNFLIFAGATKGAATRISGVQSAEIELAIQNLTRPPEVSALFITKQPIIDKNKSSEFYKFKPYIVGEKQEISLFGKSDENPDDSSDDQDYEDYNQKILRETEERRASKKKKDDDFFDMMEDEDMDNIDTFF